MPHFESSKHAKEWADAWVTDRSPSALVLGASEGALSHLAQFTNEYGRFILQFEVEFTALAELIDRLNFVDRAGWPPHRSIQYVLTAYNTKTFLSALDRLVKGYYEDSMTLIRSLYETFVRLLFVSCYPDAASAVVATPPEGVRRFNLTNFLDHDLGLQWETTYGLMSRFAHSNSYQVVAALSRAQNRHGEPERFGVRFEFEPRLAEAALPFLQFVVLAHLRFAVERLVDGTSLLNNTLLSTAKDAVDLLSFSLTDHPRDYWHRVATDLDLLFEMLEIADQREDWRAFLLDARAI